MQTTSLAGAVLFFSIFVIANLLALQGVRRGGRRPIKRPPAFEGKPSDIPSGLP